MHKRTTLGARGQVVIPAEIRKELGLVPGQKLLVEAVDGKLVAVPLPVDLIAHLTGILADGPDLLEELRQEHREEIARDEAQSAAPASPRRPARGGAAPRPARRAGAAVQAE